VPSGSLRITSFHVPSSSCAWAMPQMLTNKKEANKMADPSLHVRI